MSTCPEIYYHYVMKLHTNHIVHGPTINIEIITCIATGKSACASGGKKTSTDLFGKGWFGAFGVPTSIMCSWLQSAIE